MERIAVRRARSRADLAAVHELLAAYAEETGIDVERHGLATEMASLPGAFAPPRGALILAARGARAVGCIALRPVPGGAADAAEVKRLFVIRELRGQGVARRLVQAALRTAARRGYGLVKLDSLPSMTAAIRLYRSLGFRDVAPYHAPLEPGTLFLARRLDAGGGTGPWEREGYTISTEKRLLDLEVVHGFLRASYWSPGVPRDVVARAIRGSLCFGLHRDGRQVGFARVVSDLATFAYLADVFVLPEHRGRGLGVWLVEVVLAHPSLQGLRRFLLATRDAHALYTRHGFTPLADPSRFMERHAPDLYRGESFASTSVTPR